MPGLRRQARSLALQLLYQTELQPQAGQPAREEFFRSAGASKRARAFATALVTATEAHREEIDALLGRCMEHWRLDRVPVVVRNLLRMAVCEMIHLGETPHAVVIDEAVALAGDYVDEESARFVNGVLQRCWDERPREPAAESGA